MRALGTAAVLSLLLHACACAPMEYIGLHTVQDDCENQLPGTFPLYDPYAIEAGKCIQLQGSITKFLPKNYAAYGAQPQSTWRNRGLDTFDVLSERIVCDIMEVITLLTDSKRKDYFCVKEYEDRDAEGRNTEARVFLAAATMSIRRDNAKSPYNTSSGVVEIRMDSKPNKNGVYSLWSMRYSDMDQHLISRPGDPLEINNGKYIFFYGMFSSPRCRWYIDGWRNVVFMFCDSSSEWKPTRVLTIYHKLNVNVDAMLVAIDQKRKVSTLQRSNR